MGELHRSCQLNRSQDDDRNEMMSWLVGDDVLLMGILGLVPRTIQCMERHVSNVGALLAEPRKSHYCSARTARSHFAPTSHCPPFSGCGPFGALFGSWGPSDKQRCNMNR